MSHGNVEQENQCPSEIDKWFISNLKNRYEIKYYPIFCQNKKQISIKIIVHISQNSKLPIYFQPLFYSVKSNGDYFYPKFSQNIMYYKLYPIVHIGEQNNKKLNASKTLVENKTLV